MRRLLPLLALLAAGPTGAQTLRVTTDQAVYAYGEPIRVTVALVNDDDRGWGTRLPCLLGDFTSNGTLTFAGETWPSLCLTMEDDLSLPPRARLEWTYTADPHLTGKPDRDGRHAIRVTFNARDRQGHALVDSTTFEAPRFRGGALAIQYRSGDSTRAIALRDSLRARALYPQHRFGTTTVTWLVESAPLDSLIARYSADPRFLRFDRGGWVAPAARRLVAAEPSGAVGVDRLDGPAPHPFTDRATLHFTPAAAGPVRAEVFDALGRRVAVLHDGRGAGGVPLALGFDGAALPPGAYVVRVTTARGALARAVVRAGGASR